MGQIISLNSNLVLVFGSSSRAETQELLKWKGNVQDNLVSLHHEADFFNQKISFYATEQRKQSTQKANICEL